MKQKKALILAVLMFAHSSHLAFAHGGKDQDSEHAHGQGKFNRPHNLASIQIKSSLDSVGTTTNDSMSGRGKLNFISRLNDSKSSSMLLAEAKFPVPSAPLGITDAASAAAASIHIEFSRNGAAFSDCTLQYDPDDDDENSSEARFRLRLRSGNSFFNHSLGECPNGLPALLPGDAEIIYAVVGGARVNALDNQ